MNRRGFLGSLIAAASALTIDPERLLWIPGAKTIFLPPAIVPVEFLPNLEMINRITKMVIAPGLVDSIFRKDPFMAYLQASRRRFESRRVQ